MVPGLIHRLGKYVLQIFMIYLLLPLPNQQCHLKEMLLRYGKNLVFLKNLTKCF